MAEEAPERERFPRIELTTREAILAIGFVFLTIIVIALVQAGVISNPVSLGMMITLTVGLILIGHILARVGFLSRTAVPLWYIFTFGIVMLIYGGIMSGTVPAAFLIAGASIHEIAITNALFYTLVALAIAAAAIAAYYGYQYYKKRATRATVATVY